MSAPQTAITELLGDADLQERFQEQLQVEKEVSITIRYSFSQCSHNYIYMCIIDFISFPGCAKCSIDPEGK